METDFAFRKMFFSLEDVLKTMDSTNTAGTNRPAIRENCLKKLTSLSRFVTPCPDILDIESMSNNNNPSNKDLCSISQINATPPRMYPESSEQSTKYCPNRECSELSDSDESAWESVPTPSHLRGQWKNLLEYEELLQANKDLQSTSMSPAVLSQENNASFSSRVPHQSPTTKTETALQQGDFVEILKSIGKSLQILQANSCESTSGRFGQYIAQRLSELSEQNRAEAEIEINKVLMKYLAKDLRAESSRPPPNVDTTENIAKNRRVTGKKNK